MNSVYSIDMSSSSSRHCLLTVGRGYELHNLPHDEHKKSQCVPVVVYLSIIYSSSEAHKRLKVVNIENIDIHFSSKNVIFLYKK